MLHPGCRHHCRPRRSFATHGVALRPRVCCVVWALRVQPPEASRANRIATFRHCRCCRRRSLCARARPGKATLASVADSRAALARYRIIFCIICWFPMNRGFGGRPIGTSRRWCSKSCRCRRTRQSPRPSPSGRRSGATPDNLCAGRAFKTHAGKQRSCRHPDYGCRYAIEPSRRRISSQSGELTARVPPV